MDVANVTSGDSIEKNDTATAADSVFKKPSLIAFSSKRVSTPSKEKTDISKAAESENIDKEITHSGSVSHVVTPDESTVTSQRDPSILTTKSPIFPYDEPSWGGLPDVLYSLEELKNGVSLKKISLDERSFYCIGRLDNCHITLAHPTVSRYHAILQYRSTFSASDNKKGFYIYDLGSTHGTFVNKERVTPKIFVKLRVGYLLKFGSSTRSYLMLGPNEDQEAESEYTFSQLKQMRQQKMAEKERMYLEEQQKLEEKKAKEGINWGMGEDAEDESDLSENPFAATNNEELYLDDPKKALRAWFEREGEELVYNVDEKGFHQFLCRIDLPIANASGGIVTAEAVVSGKKKEAVLQCALEACRILDRHGLFRQESHESKRKRKLKNWEEDDYYDSDEDNFFDRTGELECKRKNRMIQCGKYENTVDTYDTLIQKRNNVLNDISELQVKLNKMVGSCKTGDAETDSLDSYMDSLQCEVVDKLEQKKINIQLMDLRKEDERLLKLINLVKPANVPNIRLDDDPGTKLDTNVQKLEKPETGKIKSSLIRRNNVEVDEEIKQGDTSQEDNKSENNTGTKNSKLSKTYMRRILDDTRLINNRNQFGDVDEKNTSKKPSAVSDDDFSNTVWTPPKGQSGDGRTSLNDKYGY